MPDMKQNSDSGMTPAEPPERPLTQERLAAVLFRLLGLYLTAFAIIGFVADAGNLIIFSMRLGLADALRGYHFNQSLIRPGAELIIGIYFLVGGQWVYKKLLAPICRGLSHETPPGTYE